MSDDDWLVGRFVRIILKIQSRDQDLNRNQNSTSEWWSRPDSGVLVLFLDKLEFTVII